MKAAPKIESSPTREKLVRAALDLMLENGFSATGVEEICQAAGVTKGSFFHYFKSKEAIGQAVLDRFVSEKRAAAQNSRHLRKEDPLDRVLGWMDFGIAESRNPESLRGCLLGTFSQELSLTHELIRRECQAKLGEWSKAIQKDLDLAARLHRPAVPIDTKSLADHCVAVFEGSILLSKARKDARPLRESLGHLKDYVKGLFGR